MEIKEAQEKAYKIREEAKKYFNGACPSHDWSHIERVYTLCNYIGVKENANLFVLQLAAFLHDVGKEKETKDPENLDHAEISNKISSEILKKYSINSETAEQVLHCIATHRFRKNKKPETLEAKILFDADKLDSIGAIGIARAYAWAGEKNIKLYSDKNYLGTGYEKQHSPVTEFKYKLKQVKDKLFTETAKKIAEERHVFMVNFFEQLNKEVKGEA